MPRIFRDPISQRSVTIVAICVFLAAITWLVFGQTVRYDFVNYDDNNYVYANPAITSGLTLHGIIGAFSKTHAHNWHPLTTLSHMLDCQLWGLRPGGHHLTNVVLHTIAVVLLFLVLHQMSGSMWRSAFVAAVFAIHPLRAESVAWVSERKDVLSAVFFMLTLGAYAHFTSNPSLGRYLTVSILFALGLMSKPMLATVPFVLVLLDYWPLGRYQMSDTGAQVPTAGGQCSVVRILVLEKVPLLILSAASAAATLWAHQPSMMSTEEVPLLARIGNALVTYVIYVKQLFWPAHLALFYPNLEDHLPVWQIGLAILLLAAVSAGAIALRRERPYIVTGWFWYLLMLLPVIGLIQVGSQAHADRYTYLPQIGLCILLAWAIPDALPSRLGRRVLGTTAGLAIIALAWCAHMQTSYWRNGQSLWTRSIAVTSRNFIAHDGLGHFLLNHGRLDEAIDQFQITLKIQPDFPEAQKNLALALTKKGRTDDAIACLQTLLKQAPNDAEVNCNLGDLLLKKGDLQSAIAAYEKALSIQVPYPGARYHLGIALDREGRADEAISRYREAIQEKPDYIEAYYLLGNDLLKKDRVDDAIVAYQEALKIRPANSEVENNIGVALMKKGRPSEAIAHWQKALAAQADSLDPLNNLAMVLATFPEEWVRNGEQALVLAKRANQLSGDNDPKILRTLAAAYAENGRYTEARVIAERGVQLANTQKNSSLASILEGDIALYQTNAPIRAAPR